MPQDSVAGPRSADTLKLVSSRCAEPAERRASETEWIDACRGYVGGWVRKYARQGVPMEDLLSAANIGLIEAARRFDPERGIRFATYAAWWVRKRVVDALHDCGRDVVSTRFRRQRRSQLDSIRLRLARRLGAEPDVEELARATGWRPRTVRNSLEPIARLVPIDPEGDGTPLPEIERAATNHGPNPLEALIARDGMRRLMEVLRTLPEREATVLLMRYGFDGDEPATLRRIGMRLGVSAERVRQIEADTMTTLRRKVLGDRSGSRGPANGRGLRICR